MILSGFQSRYYRGVYVATYWVSVATLISENMAPSHSLKISREVVPLNQTPEQSRADITEVCT